MRLKAIPPEVNPMLYNPSMLYQPCTPITCSKPHTPNQHACNRNVALTPTPTMPKFTARNPEVVNLFECQPEVVTGLIEHSVQRGCKAWGGELRGLVWGVGGLVQGHLAHKKQSPPRTLQLGFA